MFAVTKIVHQRRAFTLIELLTVIAIIGILSSILLGSVAYGIMLANRAKCGSNLRQIGVAVLAYAQDHRGYLPPTTHTTGAQFHRAWVFALAPYLQDVDEIRISPADPLGQERLRAGGTSYIVNNIIFDPKTDPFGQPLASYNNLNRLRRAPDVFLAGVISEQRTGTSAQNDHTHAEGWDAGWSAFIGDIAPNIHRVGSSNANRTNGSAPYLFADGHIEFIPAAELKERFDRGENFARPPQ